MHCNWLRVVEILFRALSSSDLVILLLTFWPKRASSKWRFASNCRWLLMGPTISTKKADFVSSLPLHLKPLKPLTARTGLRPTFAQVFAPCIPKPKPTRRAAWWSRTRILGRTSSRVSYLGRRCPGRCPTPTPFVVKHRPWPKKAALLMSRGPKSGKKGPNFPSESDPPKTIKKIQNG